MEVLTFIFSNTIIAFIILISIIIFVHELGHFLAGKLFRIQVEEFSIGFGPSAFSIKRGHTLYRINWLPLGGYVRFYGSDIEENIPTEKQDKALLHAKVYKRAVISFAGPFANFILSFFIMLGLIWQGIPTQPAIISVLPGSVADKAGLQSGDKIVSINSQEMTNWGDLVKKISKSPNQNLFFTIERNGSTLSLVLTPKEQTTESVYGTKEQSGKIGITPFFSESRIVPIQGTFFYTVGIKQNDKIISINDSKVTYYHDIFNIIKNILFVNSDFELAQKIQNEKFGNNTILQIKVLRSPDLSKMTSFKPQTNELTELSFQEKLIRINLNSTEMKNWAKFIINSSKKENKIPWIQTLPSADLTIVSTKPSSSKFQAKVGNVSDWEKCGLKENVTLASIDGETTTSIMQVFSYIEELENKLSSLKKSTKTILISFDIITKEGQIHPLKCSIPIVLKNNAVGKEVKSIEFPFEFVTKPLTLPPVYLKAKNLEDGLHKALNYLINQMLLIYNGLKMLFSGSIPLSNLGGPIAIASIAGEAAKAGLVAFFLTMSLISVNVGMVNLLPLPALDGGHLLLHIVEAFYGKSLPKRVQLLVQKAGIVLILFLFILVFYNDLLRLLR